MSQSIQCDEVIGKRLARGRPREDAVALAALKAEGLMQNSEEVGYVRRPLLGVSRFPVSTFVYPRVAFSL